MHNTNELFTKLFTTTFKTKTGVALALFCVLISLGYTPNITSPQTGYYQNMYLTDSLLFVSDVTSGIKIFSVSNTFNPRYLNTIKLAGNGGMVCKERVIYANSYDGLLALRLKNDYTYDTLSIIKKQTKTLFAKDNVMMPNGFVGCNGCGSVIATKAVDGSNGQSSSYAVFTVIDSYLYYLDRSELVTVFVANPKNICEISRTQVNFGVETLFSNSHYLFLGSSNGMYVYDRSDPGKPNQISFLMHFQAKDPVIVVDTVAYVTLRGNSPSISDRDVLLSINIRDIYHPFVIKQIAATTPMGLVASDTLLYVSSGIHGYSLYSIKDPRNISVLNSWPEPQTKDFIWDRNHLYIMGFDRLSIYEVSNPLNPRLCSIF